MRQILLEIRRSIFSGRMLGCIVAGLALLYQPEIYLNKLYTSFFKMDLSNAMQSSFGVGSYVLFATVLCVIPYSDRYCWEKRSRFFIFRWHRQAKRTYITSHILSTALSGGISLSAPFALFCFIQLMVSRETVSTPAIQAALLECALFCAYGCAWSMLSLGVSSWVLNPLVVWAAPICIERGMQLIAVAFRADYLRISDAIGYQCGSVFSLGQIAVVDIIIFLFGAVLFIGRVVRDDRQA